MSSYTVIQVTTSKLLNAFIDFPYQLYKEDSNWVPPIKSVYKDLFVPTKNPFFKKGDMQLFMVVEKDKIIGRVAAIDNTEHNELHKENIGFFGFFECIDNQEVADLLFEKAAEWVKEKGRCALRGPVSPSTNHESGFLVEGFDDTPRLMMPYSKVYYPDLVRQSDFVKVKQLWAYKIASKDVANTPKIERVARLIKSKNKVQLREINMKKFQEEIHTIVDIYNRCWSDNWGFVPISKEAAVLMAKSMKPIVEKSLILFAEINDKPVGMIVTLYDYNEILKKMKGRLFPFGIFHLFNARKKITWLRMMLIGVIPEYRGKGLDALLYYQSSVNALKLKKEYCEGSWTLEDNDAINKLASMMGGQIYKRYNLYEKAI
ncbi:hypothetical protein [Aquimarina sediminis]|uniref:hypothetical protein n=1 Tax=Aquimarina sediminis TaxID=2070536 RepID=UPI000CA07A9B|nr:hypothetical protein [Aquimarina sediminis]